MADRLVVCHKTHNKPTCTCGSLLLSIVLVQVNVKAKSAFNNKLFALNVVISIPVPDNTAKADIQTTQGKSVRTVHSHQYVQCWQCAATSVCATAAI